MAQKALRTEGSQQEKKPHSTRSFLVEIPRAETRPEREPGRREVLFKRLNFGSGSPDSPKDILLAGDPGIECQTENMPDIGGCGMTNTGDLFDPVFKLGRRRFAGHAIQPEDAALQPHGRRLDMFPSNPSDILLGKPRGVEEEIDPASMSLGLNRQNALMISNRVSRFTFRFLGSHETISIYGGKAS
jgi:hypothetical protein